MTAEVVVMNKSAVALAADSAVTIQGQKILNSANKLYMLAPGYPVGILVFNNAELMGVSWEIIIHLYRSHLLASGKRFSTLEEYPSDFIKFLKDNAEILFSKEQRDSYVESCLDGIFRHDLQQNILRHIRQTILDNASPIEEEEIKDISLRVVEAVCHQWEKAKNLDFPGEFEGALADLYRPLFDEKYTRFLGGLSLPQDAQSRLWTLFVNLFIKEYWMFQRFTGVGFAGFGDDEMFPSFLSCNFESYMANYLKHKVIGSVKINTTTAVASIIPLAQDDVVRTFLNGIHPTYEGLLGHHIEKFKEKSQAVQSEMRSKFTDPIIKIVASLPKDELANMAETLVSMTSFMRRVSSNLETVGGPIDVAVISKKDGFVWIQRKHYFKPELNYHFFDEKGKS